MSRIVLTTIGSLGDLHPKIAIALELRQRGHQVLFSTHQEYQSKLEALGFQFYRLRPHNKALNDPVEMAKMMDLKSGTEYVIRNWILPSLRETYKDLLEAAQGADVIITGEGVLAARLVAETLQIPWVFTVLQPLAFLSSHDKSVLPILPVLSTLPVMKELLYRIIRPVSKAMTQTWAEPIHQLRAELGLKSLHGNPFIDDKYSPYLVLALFSSVLTQPQPDWPSKTIITGFTFYDGGNGDTGIPPDLKRFLEAGDAPLVFTLGSAAVMDPGKFFTESIQATQVLHRRAVLLMGKNQLPTSLPNNILALPYVPHSQIFPRAAAIIHQGGIGTTAQALRAGRPTLVMPYSHDQPDNAARVERLGTSRTIRRQRYTSERVARHLDQLLRQSNYTQRAVEIQRLIKTENGVETACDAIEAQLRTTSLA